jgi:hypothetical protein
VKPVREGSSPSGHPNGSLAERTIAPGCKPGSPDTVVRIHHGPRHLASGNGLAAVPPKDGCLVRLQAEALWRGSRWLRAAACKAVR